MKSAIRSFMQKPGLNLLVIFALALGLGANTAVFSVVNGVVLKPLPFPDADRLLILRETKLPQFPEFSVSPGNFIDFEKQNSVFESMAAWSTSRFNLVEGDRPEVLAGVRVTASLFATLGVKPVLGREFSPEEDQEGKGGVVILSHRLWQQRFGGDAGVLGRSVNLSARRQSVSMACWRIW